MVTSEEKDIRIAKAYIDNFDYICNFFFLKLGDGYMMLITFFLSF